MTRFLKYSEKLAAERAVKIVKGVKGIANKIKIECLPHHKRNDIDIAAAAVSGLARYTIVPDHNIKIVVENGWLTLSVQVCWYFQKKSVELCVSNL